MKLFSLGKGNKVEVNPAALQIKEFKEVWNRCKDKDKESAIKELSYVYFLADYKSVYLSVAPEEREQVIIEDLFEDKYWKPDKEVQEAIRKYQELQVTPSMRFLDSQISALEKSIGYFKSIDYKEKDAKGKPVYSISEVTRSMKDAAGVLDSLEKIQQRVKQELDIKGKIRGSGELGLYEE